MFKVIENMKERIVRIRRRGKKIVEEAFVADTNEHNELGRVQVPRETPFRGATSDLGQCACRCNLDFQFMPRAPVLSTAPEMTEETQRGADEPAIANERRTAKKKTLTYDRAEAFYGIRLKLPADAAMREAAHSMLAMWQAAHNTDYYITKYGTKALEQLQNLVAQFAIGLRRLELDEQQEREAAEGTTSVRHQDYKTRARRVTLRLAHAYCRATWVSCCEMALYIQTLAHVRKTYYPRYIYLSRLAFMAHTCRRMVNSESEFLLEAYDDDADTLKLSTLSYSVMPTDKPEESDAAPRQTEATKADRETRDAEREDMKDTAAEKETPEEDEATDEEEATEEPIPLDDEEAADSPEENEEDQPDPDEGMENAEKMVDADLVQMKMLRATTSTHDDWLHRGCHPVSQPARSKHHQQASSTSEPETNQQTKPAVQARNSI